MTSEAEFVTALLASLPADPRLEVPAGDDAAVLRPPAGRRTVVTVDMLMEGVDFLLDSDCSPEAVGHKSLAVSLSDLAAMGAKPEAAVVAVALPRRHGGELGRGIQHGIAALAAQWGVALAGGDTNSWDGPLVVSVTAIGSVAPGAAWRRDGAKGGDLLVVTGPCGGSLLGRHLAVRPRCREASVVAAGYRVHAAIDVSDGLSLDVARMMASSGRAAVLDLAAIPIHADAVRMAALPGDGRSALEHALGDGEDFELVFALPPDEARRLVAESPGITGGEAFTIIGEVVDGTGIFAGTAAGERIPLEVRGFIHALDTPDA